MKLTPQQEIYLNMMGCRDAAKQLRVQIGTRVAEARLKKGWTLEKASQRMREKYNYTFGTFMLQNIELGKYDLKLWDIVVLCKFYEIGIDLNIK